MVDNDKVKAIIHYICINHPIPEGVNALKINKIFWFFDKFWYQKNLESATGITHYLREERGPMIDNFYPLAEELQNDGKIKISVIGENSFREKRFTFDNKENNVEEYLSTPQTKLLNEIADIIIHKYSDHDISELSHQNCWQAFNTGNLIPIETVQWDDKRQPSSALLEWVKQHGDAVAA